MGPGILAMRMTAERHWVMFPLVASVLIALTAACAAYWIMIRALEWKPKADFLRLACAAIMVRRHSFPIVRKSASAASLVPLLDGCGGWEANRGVHTLGSPLLYLLLKHVDAVCYWPRICAHFMYTCTMHALWMI
jgi:hypothetical protein